MNLRLKNSTQVLCFHSIISFFVLFITACGRDEKNLIVQKHFAEFTKSSNIPFFKIFKYGQWAGEWPYLGLKEHGIEGKFSYFSNITESSLNENSNFPMLSGDILTYSESGYSWKIIKSIKKSQADFIHKYNLYYNGIQVRTSYFISDTSDNNVLWAAGSLPHFLSSEKSFSNDAKIQSFDLTQDDILSILENRFQIHRFRLTFIGKIWLPTAISLEPGYEFRVNADPSLPGKSWGMPYALTVHAQTGEIIESSPLGFNLDGSALLYSENSVASSQEGLRKQILPELRNGALLTGKWVRVLNCKQNLISYEDCPQVIRGKNGEFNVKIEDDRYDEVNAYYSVNRAIAWHRNIMGDEMKKEYGDFGLEYPLDVFVRVQRSLPGGTTTFDTASYLQNGWSGTSPPVINIGTGWEPGQPEDKSRLHSLGKDADVFMHEFNHHVIARSIKETTEQSGGLHEGFADYFTYAITGNNTLAESVVSINSTSKALRTANILGTISEFYSRKDIHLAGEFWSTCLWDIRKILGTWKGDIKEFDKIVWDSIDYLPVDAGYLQAVLAIIRSTENFAKQNNLDANNLKSKIIDSFKKRGFFADGAPDSSGVPPPNPLLLRMGKKEIVKDPAQKIYPKLGTGVSMEVGQPGSASGEFNVTQKRFCGYIGVNNLSLHFNSSLYLFLFCSPLLLSFYRKKKVSKS